MYENNFPYRTFVAATVLALTAAPTVEAAGNAALDRLHEVLEVDALFGIMREEGLAQSDSLWEDMFPGRGGQSWTLLVDEIYDVSDMSVTFRDVFDAELDDSDTNELIDFFESERGRRIVALELGARRAMMDPAVEEAAREASQDLLASDSERLTLLQEFVTINDLVEYNVMGAMNSNLAFMRGMAEGEGFEMAEGDMLSDVWARESEIREETTEWVYAYLALAYQPLSDADVRAYLALSKTEAGRDLNRALFAGFDKVFRDVSYALGRTVSQFAVGEDL